MRPAPLARMSAGELLRESVLRAIQRVAPDADTANIAPDADLREALDIDSMDFLSIVTALHQDLGVDIPERDYPKLSTLGGALAYLEAAQKGR